MAEVPAGGSAIVKGAITSAAAANGSGNSGSAQTTVDSTDITVERI